MGNAKTASTPNVSSDSTSAMHVCGTCELDLTFAQEGALSERLHVCRANVSLPCGSFRQIAAVNDRKQFVSGPLMKELIHTAGIPSDRHREETDTHLSVDSSSSLCLVQLTEEETILQTAL